MTSRPRLGVLVLVVLVGASVAGWLALRRLGAEPARRPSLVKGATAKLAHTTRSRHRQGGLDVTFYVTADTHFGVGAPPPAEGEPPRDPVKTPLGIEVAHRRAIDEMNALPGRAYPSAVGGTVGAPRGVLIAGDLTEDGKPHELEWFERYYGLTGKDGLLRFPVFEGQGNHDKNAGWHVRHRIEERHGRRYYAWDWGDLRIACLGEGPDDEILEWLAKDLEATGPMRPVIVYFHYPLAGPFSTRHWFGDGDYRGKLERALFGYNIIAVFHGHYHASGAYQWRGHDAYNVGSPKHGFTSFAVVHVTDTRLTVASYNYESRSFWWWHQKAINGGAARRSWVSGASVGNRVPSVRLGADRVE